MVWEAAKKGLQPLYICLCWKDPPYKTQMPWMRPNPLVVRFFEDEKKQNTEDSITPRHIGLVMFCSFLVCTYCKRYETKRNPQALGNGLVRVPLVSVWSVESPYGKIGLADVCFQREERIARGYATLAMFEIWDQWSPWKQHVESLKNLLAARGWSKKSPRVCVCNSNKLCSAGGKTATAVTHAYILWGAILSPLHTESC